MVGLASWFEFTGRTIDNLNLLCQAVPVLDAYCLAFDEAYHTFANVFMDTILPVIIRALSVWMTVLSELQQVFHLLNAESLAQNILRDGSDSGLLQSGVLARNDPDAELMAWPSSAGDVPGELYRLAIVLKDAKDWWDYTERYPADHARMSRFVEVVSHSRDGFTQNRTWDLGSYRIVDTDWLRKVIPDWLADIIDSLKIVDIGGHVDVSLNRRGGTELKPTEGLYAWSGADTMEEQNHYEVYVKYPCGVKFCKKCKWGVCVYYPCGTKYCRKSWDGTVPIPIGWGSAVSPPEGNSLSNSTILHSQLREHPNQYGRAHADTPITFELAALMTSKRLSANTSLKGYSDISDIASKSRHGPQLTLVLSKTADHVPTASETVNTTHSEQSVMGLPSFVPQESDRFERIYVVAKGQVTFSHASQYANLFSPWWEGKLADTTDKERLAAYGFLFGIRDLKDFLPDSLMALPPSEPLQEYRP
jgi:hypothetical protein